MFTTRAMSKLDDDDFVPITGMARLVTELGVFLIINDGHVFIPAYCTTDSVLGLKVG
jgi:hypothetical protein